MLLKTRLIKENVDGIHNTNYRMILGYDALGEHIIVKFMGKEKKEFISCYNEEYILIGYIRENDKAGFVQCIPESVTDKERMYAIIHGKKLLKVNLI